MHERFDESPPDDLKSINAGRRQQIVDWWNELRSADVAGATTWEILEFLERQVTECLRSGDLDAADRFTAQAWLLFDGRKEF